MGQSDKTRKYLFACAIVALVVVAGLYLFKEYRLQKNFKDIVHWVEFEQHGKLGTLEGWLTIDLSNTGVNDLSPLEKYNRVLVLSVSNTDVKDLKPLNHFIHLRELYLINSNVNDLSPLLKLGNLKKLDITGLEINKEQLIKLKAANPAVEIID